MRYLGFMEGTFESVWKVGDGFIHSHITNNCCPSIVAGVLAGHLETNSLGVSEGHYEHGSNSPIHGTGQGSGKQLALRLVSYFECLVLSDVQPIRLRRTRGDIYQLQPANPRSWKYTLSTLLTIAHIASINLRTINNQQPYQINVCFTFSSYSKRMLDDQRTTILERRHNPAWPAFNYIEQPDGPAHDKPSPNGSDSMVSEIPGHKDLIASCKWYVRTPESWELNCHQERD